MAGYAIPHVCSSQFLEVIHYQLLVYYPYSPPNRLTDPFVILFVSIRGKKGKEITETDLVIWANRKVTINYSDVGAVLINIYILRLPRRTSKRK